MLIFCDCRCRLSRRLVSVFFTGLTIIRLVLLQINVKKMRNHTKMWDFFSNFVSRKTSLFMPLEQKKKKYRIRWGRVIIAFLIVVVLPIVLLVRCLCGDDEVQSVSPEAAVRQLTPQDLRCDTVMEHRIDSFVHSPQRLDSALISISMLDLTTGNSIYKMQSDKLFPPASCMKIVTAMAAIKTLGINYRYRESLQIRGKMVADTLKGNLLLCAEADPLLLSLDTLVKQLRAKGIRHIDGNVYVDLEIAERLVGHPSSKTWDIPYNKLPVLLKGSKYVLNNLIATLRANGISYHRNPDIRPTEKYHIVAQSSSPLREAVAQMLIHSSNIKAEAISYHLDYKAGLVRNHCQRWDVKHYIETFLCNTFAADSAAMVGIVVNDGSGLSPQNRLTADFLVRLLDYAYHDEVLKDYFIDEALATPGVPERRGSLMGRMARADYRGRVFVKTGTLTTIGSSSLAGFLHGFDGHWYAFAIVNADSPVAESRIYQDKICKLVMKN